jgi:hypothetical protein
MTEIHKSVQALIARTELLYGHLTTEEVEMKANKLRKKMDESTRRIRADLYVEKPSLKRKLFNYLKECLTSK